LKTEKTVMAMKSHINKFLRSSLIIFLVPFQLRKFPLNFA